MKQNIFIIFILVCILLLSACNALEQPETSAPKTNSEAAITDTATSKEASEYESIVDEVSKLTDTSIKKKYELSLDKFKFTDDRNYHYAEVKGEINNEIAKKQSAPTKTLKKASGKENRLTYVKTRKESFCQVDYYIDEQDPTCYHLYNNNTGEYMGQRRCKYDDNIIIQDKDEFRNKALEVLKENNVDISDYEFEKEEFVPLAYDTNWIEFYIVRYAKKINGISTPESATCFVYADGITTYEVYNKGMFDNIDVPEIDLKDVLPLATEKAECVLENIPESCELVGVGMKDHLFYVDASGQLMFSFKFQYTLYTPNEVLPITYTEGIPMAIVID